ncbi:MAG: radical SAM family heme chaperone HemW [Helicobacter sp.]|nr:radical SAM family heme chaperone HemW [Helicobacter sp.]
MTLYIHIPFCTSRCGYCAFNTFSNSLHLKEPYICALISDIKASAKKVCDKTLDSIFIGGGTPNTLETSDLARIFETIYENFAISKHCEITSEANPDLATKSWLKCAKSLGVTRISFGAQSFLQDKLDYLQREHNADNILKALDLASEFENLSIDLIYNTPLDTKNRLEAELEIIKKLNINHISAYSLELESGAKTKLENNVLDFSHFLAQGLSQIGFSQYEVSNFGAPYKCKHNLSYWSGLDYLGVGAGGISKIGNSRFYPHNAIPHYIQNPHFRNIERLSFKDLQIEALFLGLRSEIGVPLKILKNESKIKYLCENNCYIKNDRLFAKDYFLGDELALFLMD